MARPDPVEAARRFLDDLMPLLKEGASPVDQPLELPWPRWLPVLDMGLGTRRYKVVPIVLSAEQQCGVRMLGELQAGGMQALTELERALADDPTIGPRLDREVSSSGAGGHTWQAFPLVLSLVDRAISDADGFDLEGPIRDCH
jgi:hypothetical protein